MIEKHVACPHCFSERVLLDGVEAAHQGVVVLRLACNDCEKISCLEVVQHRGAVQIRLQKMKLSKVGVLVCE